MPLRGHVCSSRGLLVPKVKQKSEPWSGLPPETMWTSEDCAAEGAHADLRGLQTRGDRIDNVAEARSLEQDQ